MDRMRNPRSLLRRGGTIAWIRHFVISLLVALENVKGSSFTRIWDRSCTLFSLTSPPLEALGNARLSESTMVLLHVQSYPPRAVLFHQHSFFQSCTIISEIGEIKTECPSGCGPFPSKPFYSVTHHRLGGLNSLFSERRSGLTFVPVCGH
jgi:hypothetical protein